MKFDPGAIVSSAINNERVIGLVTGFQNYTDLAVSPQTGRARISFEENSGIATAVPADALIELMSREDLRKLEDQIQ